jgi:peptide/nickel transport system ATP-binding protein
MNEEPLLDVSALRVRFPIARGFLDAVDGIDFRLGRGERIALVGESGAGKSLTAMALMGLVPRAGAVSGSIRFAGRELVGLRERELARIRGSQIGLILQDAVAALDPLKSIGSEIEEALRAHTRLPRSQARERTLELIEQVQIGDAATRVHQRGYELSGGMAQRALIAAAVGPEPELLVADEPTSALDATTAEGVLDLLDEVVRRRAMAVLLITHDLGVVARFAERVIVMYAGRIVEDTSVGALFSHPRHPYTRGLLESMPGAAGHRRMHSIPGAAADTGRSLFGCAFQPRCFLSRGRERCRTERPALSGVPRSACHFAGELDPLPPPDRDRPRELGTAAGDELVALQGVSKSFKVRGGPFRAGGVVHAVHDATLGVRRGEVLALVGESGCGKTTLAKVVLGLEPPSAGHVRFDGHDVTATRSKALRRRIQVVFQNPDSSLDPRMTIERVVAEPLEVHRIGGRDARRARVAELIERVGLHRDHLRRYPYELSGGQRQRVAIARALAPRPDFLVCDEPLTALDVSVQAQILELLQEIQRTERLSCLFVAHDLGVVREFADRVAVMYLGHVVEVAESGEFFARPHHPYSLALLSAASTGDPAVERRKRRIVLSGALPSPLDPPPGCPFHTRCWKAQNVCAAVTPPPHQPSAGRLVACHFPEGVEDAEAVAAGGRRNPR